MNTRRILLAFIMILSVLWAPSCSDNRDNFTLNYPDYFPEPVYKFENNPISREKFELGRKLFHDPILSRDSSLSCATCHAQGHAFADHNIALSVGIDHRIGSRNSPSIVNVAWQPHFMWDGGINHIEIMPFAPITNPVEMDEDLGHVVAKLNQNEIYTQLFKHAFGNAKIESQQMFYVLAQYMAFLISDDSKYDRVRQGKETFTLEENQGYQIFLEKCNTCHQEPLFTDFSFRNNGLQYYDADLGRYRITQFDADKHKFKVPSLRNITLTYPYMHDGQLASLDAVLEHYNSGIIHHENLDPILIKNGRLGILLDEQEKNALKTFLKTLTDQSYLSNPLFTE